MSTAHASKRGRSDGSDGPLVFSLRVPRKPTASSQARHAIRTRLSREPAPPLAERALDDLLVVVSDLVSQAVVHGEGEIELRLRFDDAIVSGEVVDRGAGAPSGHPPAGLEGDDGLLLVGRIAERWGVHESGGHAWFEIRRSDDTERS